jgi:DNA-binding FrmR family transcriptional regulator
VSYTIFGIYPRGVYDVNMITDIKKRATHRAKIIEGQIKGLQKMIDTEAYCMDILTQNLAIQKSLASLNKLILENHIRTHITDMMTSGDEVQQQKALDELLKLYELNNIRGK